MGTTSPEPLAFAIGGPLSRADLPGLCERACAFLEGSPGDIAVCDVCDVDTCAVTVDALARLQLAASRRGRRFRLRNASSELLELVTFMGLRDVLAE